jgi:pimeloyl-ACP methyl ester carboxylesterase
LAEIFLISDLKGEANQHVLFFHGLGGDPYLTWRSSSAPIECWLQWLADDIDGLAVWTVGYEAAVSRWRGSAMHLTDRAVNVLERVLLEKRLQTGEIVLVGHSLGGLVIKQLLRTAESMVHKRDDVATFLARVRRVAFLATPHAGAASATLGDRLRVIIRPSAATACLVRNDPHLRDLNQWYRDWSDKHSIKHLILTETKPSYKAILVVKPDSSDPGLSSRPIPIDADHLAICKPNDRSSEIYQHIRDFIKLKLENSKIDTFIEGKLEAQSDLLEEIIDSTQKSKLQIEDAFLSLNQAMLEQSERTAEKVADRILDAKALRPSPKYPKELVDSEIERSLSNIRRARFFRGSNTVEESIRLAEKIQNGEFEGGSGEVKSRALAWCARLLAVGENCTKADELLSEARQFGNGPEIAVAVAFRISADDFEEALSKLAAVATPVARSASFIIVANNKDTAYAVEWISKSGISYSSLDADGKFLFITKQIELGFYDSALEYANELKEEDFLQVPVLFHLAAMVNLLQVIPDELKSYVLPQIPFEARNFPLASNEAALRFRREAQDLFYRCSLAAKELGCIDVANAANDYALWLELRDPEGWDSAIQKLQASMRDPAQSLRRLHLALHFGIKLDLKAVEQEIDRETALSGGKSQSAAMARFCLAFTQDSPKSVAAYIERHRDQLNEHLEKKTINMVEIEMLIRAGLPQRAEERLKELINEGVSEGEQNHLCTIIAESKGADPIETRKAQFESSGQLNDLATLVSLLEETNDLLQLCHYSSLLFERTLSLADAEHLARALNEAHRYADLLSFLKRYPEFVTQSDNLQMLWSWSLYREGELAESAAELEKLRIRRDDPNDRALTVNLAIASGNWDAILTYVENEWTNKEQREADDLIRIAQIAQGIGSPRAKDLMYAAAAKGSHKAGILSAAYFIATSAGWENEPLVGQWLHNAAELSGDDGPIQKMSLKDLLDRAPEWNRRETDVWQQINQGIIPIFGFATLLNKSLVDLFLLPALANPTEPDPRKRSLVPAYSGVRQPMSCDYRVIAMESTALLTLGSLGLLEIVFNGFERIIIPHSTLGWLFEEKQKVSYHQPSKIKSASKIRQLLATGALKEFAGSAEIDTDLADEIGEDLASLIAEAQEGKSGDDRQRLVIRSSPVHRVGSLMEEVADLSPYYPYLCSCLAVVNKLKQKGQLTAAEELRARSYLILNEKEWPHQPEISDGAVLFLDDLSETYLQHAGVLEKLHLAGFEVYVTSRDIKEVNAFLHYEQLTSEVSRVLESIRYTLASCIKAGKVQVGRMSYTDISDETPPLHQHPTFAIVSLAQDVDAIIVDDRFLNQHHYVEGGATPTPVLTTLDLLNSLYTKGQITFEQMLDSLTKLRQFGYLFIPITTDELEHYLDASEVVDGRLIESAELKAIRENLQRVRMSCFLQLPKEAHWLSSLMQMFSNTLKAQWRPDVDVVRASARSEWLLSQINLRGWAHCFGGDGGMQIVDYGYSAQIMSLLFTPPDVDAEFKVKYQEWIDKNLLLKLQNEDPALYLGLISKTEKLILNAVESTLIKGLDDEE